jgi:hypothetical protein
MAFGSVSNVNSHGPFTDAGDVPVTLVDEFGSQIGIDSNPLVVDIGSLGSTPVSLASSNGTPIASATDTTAVAAPAAGNHLKIWRIHASNSGATSTWVYWRNGASGTRYFQAYLPTNGIVSLRLDGIWELSSATALVITTTAAGSIEWTVGYRTEAD